MSTSGLGRAWAAYMRVLAKRPMATQIVQTGLIVGSGDVISQTLVEKSEGRFEAGRALRFAALGSFFVAPTIRIWYLAMERMLGTRVDALSTFKKVAVDQGLFAPLFSAAFISWVGLSRGDSPGLVRKNLEDQYLDVLFNGWKLWPAAQLINFYFVPFLLRPLYVSFVSLFWNTYLAWKVNRPST